jgi:ssDNA-binding Zn-finger/Zn-ribbon topoisomerase 1
MFMYYETDGDSGYYNIKLFTSRLEAEKYHKAKGDAYGHTTEIEVDEGLTDQYGKKRLIEDTLCPECNSKMVSRKGQFGTFWGCSKYPDCRGTRDSQGRSKAERRAEKDKEETEKVLEQDPDYILDRDMYRFRKS